ncbi:WYL domain-containing protein [Streptomyces scabiei]|uniref:WYL domain-containing protein n=1 Tax=Streptomyces scabiei TaxID=1930 RepID=UPI001B30D195|nr:MULTISPECIES: WYL domain-containing protein [Streptomyces]MBP5870868.1 WYL domain-containing protein [Streptomyces sp. LBUM 1485]MBP5913228.1 WYL domain-containing protein [Streptomyces sp. LBUM 1486]MDX2532303.1 WYL domain-containing protein [Streptomyces scabiei]MDX2794609.1 WYL domain-containing protein [Streptomyces scabiei]MDX3822389.1 WYL domain-containing protein [Streptomyces scabiei]
MRRTANETSTTTLTRLIKALDAKHPITITYTKADGTETIRTIEIADIIVTNAGDIVLRAADRDTQEMRSFRLDRLVSYTVHRTAYVVERPAADEPKQCTTTGLNTVTVLYPVDCPATARVQLLADALAA